MAKKVRRVRKKKGKAAVSVEKPTLSAAEQFQQDYAYVLKDLRRVFILAGIMFALLIILNLVLPLLT